MSASPTRLAPPPRNQNRRSKADLNAPLQVVDIEQGSPNSALALRNQRNAPPGKGPPPMNLQVPVTPDHRGKVSFDGTSARVMEDVDSPAEVPQDPFETMINAVIQEHHKQIDALRDELDLRNEKLNVVLSTTWNFSEEGWHGRPSQNAAQGVLELNLAKQGKEKNKLNAPAWSVSEDEQHKHKAKKGMDVTYKARVVWKAHEWGVGKQFGGGGAGSKLEDGPGMRGSLKSNLVTQYSQHMDIMHYGEHDGRCARLARCHGRFIVHPASTHRLVWDAVGMALLFWDVIMIPLSAYDPERIVLVDVMDWFTLVFWTCDMVASFFTGFFHKGKTMMNPRDIAKHYFGLWFWIDIIVVGPDWCFTFASAIIGGASDAANAASLLRILRVVRVLRLLRMAKLKRFIAMAKDNIESEAVFLVVGILQFVVGLLFLNHFTSAMWYLVGAVGRSLDAENWIESKNIQDASLHFRYFNSLHWSLSQFAPGWFDSSPKNSAESCYAILVLLLGMVTCGYFTASLTHSMTRLSSMGADTKKQFWLLRRYLRQNDIESALSHRILRHLEYANSLKEDVVGEDRLPMLSLLPDNLASELSFRIHFGPMLHHPLFRCAYDLSESCVTGFAGKVVTEKFLQIGDTQFQADDIPTHMVIITDGKFIYTKEDDEDMILEPDDWACEHSLWVGWVCRGDLTATTDSHAILVDSKLFADAVLADGLLWAVMVCYAEVYVGWLNHVSAKFLNDVATSERNAFALADKFVGKAQNLRTAHEKSAVDMEEKEAARIANALGQADEDDKWKIQKRY